MDTQGIPAMLVSDCAKDCLHTKLFGSSGYYGHGVVKSQFRCSQENPFIAELLQWVHTHVLTAFVLYNKPSFHLLTQFLSSTKTN